MSSTLLGGRANLATSQNVEEIFSLSSLKGFIWLAIIILLKVCLKPLAKLKIILIFSLNQFAHFDVTLDTIFVKCILENLVILHKFILMFCIPLHFTEPKRAWV